MSTQDPNDRLFAQQLRAHLDDELDDVRADRRMLAQVLAQPPRRRWSRPEHGLWTWLPVAAAVAVVAAIALSVPLLRAGQHARPPASPPASGGVSTPPTPAPSTPPTPAPSTPATPAPSTPATPAPSTASTAARGSRCAPQTSNAGDVALRVDLDGDGVPDTLSYNGGSLHVILGAGHGELRAPLSTASPYVTALAVSTDASRGSQVLIGTRGAISAAGEVGVVARLYALRGCTFAPVLGVNGRPYDFLVGQAGPTERSGLVCRGGVLYGRTSVLRGGVWQVTDTPVSSVSGTAVNGAPGHRTVRDGTAEAASLASQTCGRSPTTIG